VISGYYFKTQRVWTQLGENLRILVASCVPRTGLPSPRRDLSKLFRLEGLDVLEAVHHATADLEEAWGLTEPPPALQGAHADLPAIRDLDLGEVANHAFVLLKHHCSPRRLRLPQNS
jgi:hypothetical protein